MTIEDTINNPRSEQTLLIIKPDAIERGLQFIILQKVIEKGYSIPCIYQTHASEELLREHYQNVFEDKGPEIGEQVVEYMSSGPVIVAVVQGNKAVEQIRKLCGEKTEPTKCPQGTIRSDYAASDYDLAGLEGIAVKNLVHTSDSPESAIREIELWCCSTEAIMPYTK